MWNPQNKQLLSKSLSPCLSFRFFVIHLRILAQPTPTESKKHCISITTHTFHQQLCTLYLPAAVYLSAALAWRFGPVLWAVITADCV